MPRALLLSRNEDRIEAAVTDLAETQLPEGDVEVEVLYSSLNYKDGLAVTGKGKIVRAPYPFVPGIDLVGRVRASEADSFADGDLVIATGWGLGESHWGGYAEVQRVRSSSLVPLPEGLSPRAAMVAGTAGLTAMLSVLELEARGVAPGSGEVLVTGASGGVGSLAVALLSAEGYDVAAATGSGEAHDYLRRLGAERIVPRTELAGGSSRPLESAKWAGAVDVVGGRTLEAILSRLDRHGAVAVCGLTGGHELRTTVYPFILRGISMLGIDSNTCPNDVRRHAWARLANSLTGTVVREIEADVIGLDDVVDFSERILSGSIRGRVVVDLRR